MHASVDVDGFELHSKIGDIQPVGFPDNMPAKLEANHTNSQDWDISTIGHVDKSVVEWCHGFKVTLVASQAEVTAGVNAKEILRRGRNCACPSLEEASRERQG